MAFSDIPGNAPIKEILRRALRRRAALPSLLLCGSPGAGQRETALELAKAFNCHNLEDDACGECPSCKAIDAGNHPDIIDVRNLPRKKPKPKPGEKNGEGTNGEEAENGGPEEAEEKPEDPAKRPKNIVIDQMRRAVELALMKPMIGRKRVFLVDDAAEMEEEAANASLKILEEPPSFTQFILITANPDVLLPTIRSRCRTLTFGPVESDEIAAVLRNRGFDDARAASVAALVRGDFHRAVTADWDEFFEERAEAWDWFRAVVTGNNGTEFVRKVAGGRKTASREDMEKMIVLFRGFGRDLLALGETGGSGSLFNPDLEAELRELASAVPPERALRLVRAADTALASLEQYANIRLLATVLFARMTG